MYQPPPERYVEPMPEFPEDGPAWSTASSSVIIAVERLMGVQLWRFTAEPSGDRDRESTGTSANLLWGSSYSGAGGLNPYAVPSLSVHGVIPGGVTLGGSLGYMTDSGETEASTIDEFGDRTTTTEDLPESTVFAFAPRVGFILRTTDVISLWLRVGVTYHSIVQKLPEFKLTTTGVAVSVDPMLVITPVPRVGFMVGPILDFGVSGSAKISSDGSILDPSSSNEVDVTRSNYGGAIGVAVFL